MAGCRPVGGVDRDPHVLAANAEMPEEVTVPLLRDRRYFRAPVEINGVDVGTFLVDTGAALMAADLGVVRRLELEANGGGTAIGIAGRERFAYYDMDSLAVGEMTLSKRRVAGLNMRSLHRHRRSRLDGILGYTTLAEVPFTIDGPARELVFHRRESFSVPEGLQPIRLIRFRHLPTVEAELGDGRRIWLVLDTGADEMLSLPIELASRWPDILSTSVTAPSMNRGVGGVVIGRKAWVTSLAVFGKRFVDVQATFAAPPESFRSAPVPVGRIGNAFLKRFRLTFDNQAGRMWAELDREMVQSTGDRGRTQPVGASGSR